MMEELNYSDNESDDDESHRFFSVCAENKINAMIARMRESENERFDEPEEFENEAVTMAIQQHGLKNCQNLSPRDSLCECSCEINENHCNQSAATNADSSQPTSSAPLPNDLINSDDSQGNNELNPKTIEISISDKSKAQQLTYMDHIKSSSYEFSDVDFLNEAVAAAIRKKDPCQLDGEYVHLSQHPFLYC